MIERDLIQAAKAAAGVDTKPAGRTYFNPRNYPPPVEEPVEDTEKVEQPGPINTAMRPRPVDGKPVNAVPTGGSEPYALPEPDRRAEARAAADLIWQRERGLIPPTPIPGRVEGRLV